MKKLTPQIDLKINHGLTGLLTILWLLALLSSCRVKEPDGSETADLFLRSYYSKDFNTAGLFVSGATKPFLDSFVSDMAKHNLTFIDSFELAYLDEISTGDSLIVQYALDSNKFENPLDILLVKKGTEWKVVYRRSDPIGVAQAFLNAFNSGDTEKAKKYVTPGSVDDIDIYSSLFKNWTGPQTSIINAEINEQESEAVIHYRELGNETIKNINLVNFMGKWKVTFTKISHS